MREISLSVAVFQPDAASTVQIAIAAERAGIDAIWLPAVPMAFDPLTLLGTIAARTDRIAIGTGIVPTYPRHPALLVSQILSVAPFARERLRIGVGSSHPFIIEGMLGIPFHPPIAHLREYLAVARGLLEHGKVEFSGRYFNVRAQLAAPPAPVPLAISALRARMFRLAGELADGALSAWCPIPYLLGTALPEMARGARAAGRPRPPLVANIPVVWSTDGAAVREAARAALGMYLIAPAYVEMFQRRRLRDPAQPRAARCADRRAVRVGNAAADRRPPARRAPGRDRRADDHPPSGARAGEGDGRGARRARQPEPRPAELPPRLKGVPP